MLKRRFTLILAGAAISVLLAAAAVLAAPSGEVPGPQPQPAGSESRFFLPLLGRGMTAPLLPPAPTPVSAHPGYPLARFETGSFTGPAVCDKCHSDLKDESGADVTNSTLWRATMMANAATDPLWQAKVSSEIARHPELQSEIERICSRCHMPMANVQALANGQTPAILGDGFLNPANPLHEAALGGVSCTLCHQIQPDKLGTDESYSGGFVIDTAQSAPDRQLYGPYPTPDMIGAMVMRSGAGYDPIQGKHIQRSELCATCHTLFTPTVTAEGAPAAFPEQVPYQEWQHSSFGDGTVDDQQCQDCHMPTAQGAVVLFNGWPAHEPFYQHTFVSSNVTMLKILQAHVAELKLGASTAEFQRAIDDDAAYLREKSADVNVSSAQVAGGALETVVHVTNKVGHKFPTGYPSRRAWLHVVVSDAQGRVAFESGRAVAHGAVLDNDADLDPAAFEGHYDLITSPDQVQIYETVMADSQGAVTYTLLNANHYVKDNRLLPDGFDKATAKPEVAVVGEALADPNFVGGSDEVTYRVSVTGFSAPFTVSVELLYQPVPYAFVHDLGSDATPETERFAGYYAAADKTPALVASAQRTVAP